MARKSESQDTERVQVGIRLEKRMIKVLKGIAEFMDMSLNDLVEDILLRGLEGSEASALNEEQRKVVADLKKLYGMNYDACANDIWRDVEPTSGAV